MVHCAAGIGKRNNTCMLFCKIQKIFRKCYQKNCEERPGSIQSQIQELAYWFYEKHKKLIRF